MTRVSSRRHFKQRDKIVNFTTSVLALLTVFLLSRAEHSPATPESSPEEQYTKYFSPDYWYLKMLDTPQPPAEHVSVVILDKHIPDQLAETYPLESAGASYSCKIRPYIADLLKSLCKSSPKVVVLDMWFDPEYCSDLDSRPLWNELDALSGQVPIVSGLGSYNYSEVQSGFPAELARIWARGSELKDTELVLMPAVKMGQYGKGRISEGVVELDSDSRKVPLSWPAYDSFETVGGAGQPHRIDSLSVAAVRAFNPRSAVLNRIGALDEQGMATASTELFPYTTFLQEEGLPIARAIDVIRSNPTTEKQRTVCRTFDARPLDSSTLFAGRIILVGDAGIPLDTHRTLIGIVPGVVLHAEYIEALLEDRVYKPIPTFLEILAALVWLGVLIMISLFIQRPILAILYLLAAVVLPAYFIHRLILYYRFYTPLLLLFILAGIVLLLNRVMDRFLSKQEERQ